MHGEGGLPTYGFVKVKVESVWMGGEVGVEVTLWDEWCGLRASAWR